ncbi:hypothetical protein LPN04_06260 [Rugamonas sp. A1-17]|nr:hypothetical protein [Rugamonas sp. A1-17]
MIADYAFPNRQAESAAARVPPDATGGIAALHPALFCARQPQDLGLRRIQVFGCGEFPHTGAHHTGDASDSGDDAR